MLQRLGYCHWEAGAKIRGQMAELPLRRENLFHGELTWMDCAKGAGVPLVRQWTRAVAWPGLRLSRPRNHCSCTAFVLQD
jgi:hypothetical protein